VVNFDKIKIIEHDCRGKIMDGEDGNNIPPLLQTLKSQESIVIHNNLQIKILKIMREIFT
jgi:hypothetical protein